MAIPPHGCWQCRELWRKDEGSWELTQAMFLNYTEVPLKSLSESQREAMRKRGQDWVDERYAEAHRDHKPESWI